MKQKTKETIKRWVISSALTFATAAGIVMLAQWDNFTLDTVKDGTYLGVLFTAGRAGLKALLEAFLAWRGSK